MRTYFVAKNGQDSDSWSGDSSQPFRTLTYAIGRMVGGDVLIVGDGVYAEGNLSLPGGSAAGFTIIRAQNRNAAIVQPVAGSGIFSAFYQRASYAVFDGIMADAYRLGYGVPYYAAVGESLHDLVFQNGTAKGGRGGGDADNESSGVDVGQVEGKIIIRNMDLIDNGSPGSNFDHQIYLSGSFNLIEGNRIRGSQADGEAITLHDVSGRTVTGNVIRKNSILDNKGHAIVLSQLIDGAEILENFISGNAVGVYNYNGSIRNVRIEGNRFQSNRGAAVVLTPGSVNTLVNRNVFAGNGYDGVENGGQGTIQEGNVVEPPGGIPIPPPLPEPPEKKTEFHCPKCSQLLTIQKASKAAKFLCPKCKQPLSARL